ncbi:MAG: poly(R)-hydroxyalkanoic acid synthase subunit PhaE [Pseudomonadota bacterium]
MTAAGPTDRDLLRLWLEASEAMFSAGGKAGEAWERSAALFEMWSKMARLFGGEDDGSGPFNPAQWLGPGALDGMADFTRWLEGPDFADLLRCERDALRESAEWLEWMAAAERFRTLVGQAWMRAFRTFLDGLAARETAGEGTNASWQAVQALWTEIADRELAQAQRSEAFLAAQQRLIRSQLALKNRLRARLERVAEFLGLPTRAELDDLHQTVHALRREIRQMKRERARQPDPERP